MIIDKLFHFSSSPVGDARLFLYKDKYKGEIKEYIDNIKLWDNLKDTGIAFGIDIPMDEMEITIAFLLGCGLEITDKEHPFWPFYSHNSKEITNAFSN
jgi:hypothetical protein